MSFLRIFKAAAYGYLLFRDLQAVQGLSFNKRNDETGIISSPQSFSGANNLPLYDPSYFEDTQALGYFSNREIEELQIELKWDREVLTNEWKSEWTCPSTPLSLLQLHRFINMQYQSLPWPTKFNKVSIINKIVGGKGDLSASAKVITLMQKISPSFEFDWVIGGGANGDFGLRNARSFLSCSDPSKVKIRSLSMMKTPMHADLLVDGPVLSEWGLSLVTLQGPSIHFLENAKQVLSKKLVFKAVKIARNEVKLVDLNELYRKVHETFFPSQPMGIEAALSMGLQQGSGVFLDESRMNAPLSREFCCPSYLLELEDQELQNDILSALGGNGEKVLPDYDTNSLNSGYAHHPRSWAKFIDFVTIHERDKNVTIVLNQRGEFENLDAQNFCEKIFTPERLVFLKEMGYGTVTIKECENDSIIAQESSVGIERKLTIILRESFSPSDMRLLQLASERLLATGDNSAAEAWAARCKLYVYEDVANAWDGCKKAFLEQQVELAKTISSDLGTLLQLFGRTDPSLSADEMSQVVEILRDPSLSQETLQFCNHITTNYSFGDVLEAVLKRAAWHYYIPELMNEESDVMDDGFKAGFIHFLANAESLPQTINVRNLRLLEERIRLRVEQYLKNETTCLE